VPASEPAPLPAGIPAAEIETDETLVLALLRAQHADLAGLPLRHAATGWDNATYRLGDRLAVRLPRILAAVNLIRNEQRWLPVLASRLPIPVPAPVRVGEPEDGFPWPWSVVPWVPGRSAEHEPPAPAEAGAFGRFLAAVHRPAPDGFPRNDWRGVPLADVSDRLEQRLHHVSTIDGGLPVPAERVWDRWRQALAAPPDPLTTCVHGDLHPKNLVVDKGRLVAVLDWGDMTAGDPATDLGAAWMLFPVEAHGDAWAAYGPIPAATMARAAGWAVFFGVTLLDVGLASDPPFAEIGRRTLTRLCR
jgi:aminoglycoside phosphotransferase (APT) family kinase protein